MHLCPRSDEVVERVEVRDSAVYGLGAWPVGNRVGEAPCWDRERRVLVWIDVRAPEVLELDPATGCLRRWALPEPVGAAALAVDGRVCLALAHRIAVLDRESGALETHCMAEPDLPHNRLNDGKASPSGAWMVFGSMDDRASDKQATGSLWRVGADGQPERLFTGLTVANGVAFADGGATLIFSDSHRATVWRAPWDEASGTMGEPRQWLQLDEATGRPDGAAVDAHGSYWSAGVSAGCLNGFSPDGMLHTRLALPCGAPTMPAFDSAGRVWVTSLVRPQWTQPDRWQGALFDMPAPTLGAAEPLVRWR